MIAFVAIAAIVVYYVLKNQNQTSTSGQDQTNAALQDALQAAQEQAALAALTGSGGGYGSSVGSSNQNQSSPDIVAATSQTPVSSTPAGGAPPNQTPVTNPNPVTPTQNNPPINLTGVPTPSPGGAGGGPIFAAPAGAVPMGNGCYSYAGQVICPPGATPTQTSSGTPVGTPPPVINPVTHLPASTVIPATTGTPADIVAASIAAVNAQNGTTGSADLTDPTHSVPSDVLAARATIAPALSKTSSSTSSGTSDVLSSQAAFQAQVAAGRGGTPVSTAAPVAPTVAPPTTSTTPPARRPLR